MREITISLWDAGLLIIGIGLTIFIFYCVVLVKNLIPSAKSLAKIMQDAEVVSGAAAEGAQGAQQIVENVNDSVSTVSDLIRGNQSYISAVTNLVNAFAALRNLLGKKTDTGE